MFNLFPSHSIRPQIAIAPEHASWMVVVAAETISNMQVDPVERGRYAEVARRMRWAACRLWSDAEGLRAASPTVSDPDGAARPMVELIARYDDPEAGVRAAMTLLLGSEWRPAA